MKSIKTFLYIDIESLYSLYSQVFEGLAEQITKQTLNEVSREKSLSEADDKSFDTKVAQASLKTENSILYDHMYNRLEDELNDAVLGIDGIDKENYQEKLGVSFLVKCSGNAEIHDYSRLSNFTKNFNKICEDISYIQLSSVGITDYLEGIIDNQIEALEEEKNVKNNHKKKSIENKISALVDKKTDMINNLTVLHSKSLGRIDSKFKDILMEWMNEFYPDGYEFTIVPEENEEIVYRGVLDKKYLRLNPTYVRALYGEKLNSNWVMVGQVTYIPQKIDSIGEIIDNESLASTDDLISGNSSPNEEKDNNKPENTEIKNIIEEVDLSDDSLEEDIDMENFMKEKLELLQEQTNNSGEKKAIFRDPCRGLFEQASTFDKIFFESGERIEVLLRPLAIYQETTIGKIKNT